MIDAVDRVIAEREALDRGLPPCLAMSMALHAFVVGLPLLASLFVPKKPLLQIVDGIAIALPRGGGGGTSMSSAPPPPGGQVAPPAPAAPKILKPPKDEPPPSRGVPALDAKKGHKAKPEKTPSPRGGATGVPGGTGAAGSETPGLSLFGPPGPGVPDGVDSGGDWYLAGVQQRIFAIWAQQIKAGFKDQIAVLFTIRADGGVEDVKVAQPSGVTLLDLAAQRAILSAAPFGPLPRQYGTNRLTIQAIFKPTP